MRVWKFEGATMRDAIAKVKAELGDQAVIISTRQIRKGLLGSAVEISAAIDSDDRAPAGPLPAPAAPPPPPPVDVEKQLAPLRSEMRSLRALVRNAGEGRGTTELRAELAALRRLVETIARPAATAAPPVPNAAADPAWATGSRQLSPAPAQEVAPRGPTASYQAAAPARRPTAAHDTAEHASHDTLEPARSTPGYHAAPTAPRAPAHEIPLTAASSSAVVMLIGPTGAGKTTTIAKLAARAALIDHRRVSLVTLDNYRVGGIDQIRTFAELIGVPLQVADGPAQLARLLDPASDLTLIDTAGRSPRDVAAIEELARHTGGLGIEVHLVVPAGSSGAQVDELLRRYRALAPVRLLFTKLDECTLAPELALAPARTRLPITWVTTGQAVPEDIEQPTSARVLELAGGGLHEARIPTNRSHRAA